MRGIRLPRRRALTCQELVELVTAYLDDALPHAQRRRVEQHLAGCEDCHRYLDQIRATLETLGSLPADGLSDEAYIALADAFRDISGRSGRSGRDGS